RPAVYHSEREADAKAANKVFNSEGIKADPSKFLFAGDSGGGDGSTVVDGTESLGDAKEKSKHAEDCGLVADKDDDSGQGGEKTALVLTVWMFQRRSNGQLMSSLRNLRNTH